MPDTSLFATASFLPTDSAGPLTGNTQGLLDWPSSAPYAPALPDTLPDGRAWPRVSVLTVANSPAPCTTRSVEQQAHPDIEHIVEACRPGEDVQAAWRRALARAAGAFIVRLPDGDMLAAGSLASACLAAAMADADGVAGLRVVLGDGGVCHVDVIDQGAGGPGSFDSSGADLMVARTALDGAGVARPLRLTVIGRPMVLHVGHHEAPPPSPALSVVALTDSGAGGGASIAHRRLLDALRLAEHRVEVKVLVDRPSPATAEWVDAFPVVEAEIAAGAYDLVLTGNIHAATRRADVLARIHRHVPVATVLHDMFMLTGRCDVPLDCPLIHDRCTAACPTHDAYPYLSPDRILSAWHSKRDFMRLSPPPLLLANSFWTEQFARAVLGAELAPIVQRIDLPFPTQVFRPRERGALRRALGLPEADVLIGFAAVNSDNPMKGIGDIHAALKALARPGIGFVVIGRIDDPAALALPNLFAPGPITEETRVAEWFAACDLHITASRFESLGQTPIESGLCGTPTVAYRRTGLSTSVIDGVSGALAEPNPDAFAQAVRRLVEDADQRSALGAWGRMALEARHSHAASYLSLLRALRGHGLMPPAQAGARVRFAPAILRTFDIAGDPLPGAAGTVGPPSGSVTRMLRRVKHAVWGRRMPLWMRVAMRIAQSVRARARAQSVRTLAKAVAR